MDLIESPYVPVQLESRSMLRRGEPSGEILCPKKLAHIGEMRCAEYQESQGCGAGCAVKVAAERVAELRRVMQERDAQSETRRPRNGGRYDTLKDGSNLCRCCKIRRIDIAARGICWPCYSYARNHGELDKWRAL